jgi:NitT/TauT family transport system substrate-binding protein
MRVVTRAALLQLALAGLGATAVPGTASAQTVTIRAGGAIDDGITPLLLAQHDGYFQRHGLEVEFSRLNSGSAVAAAVAGGTFDVGKSSVYSLISAHAHGIPFQLIATTSEYHSEAPDAALLVRSDASMRKATDLAGKIVGVASLEDVNAVATKAWVDKNGGDSQALRFLEVPLSALGAALQIGRVDVAPMQEPLLSTALAAGNARILGYHNDGIAPRYANAGVFATADWIAKNTASAAKFAQAMQEANRYLAAHESEGVPLIAQFVGIDPGATIRHPGRPLYLAVADVQPLIDAAARYKIIPQRFPASELISGVALRPPR